MVGITRSKVIFYPMVYCLPFKAWPAMRGSIPLMFRHCFPDWPWRTGGKPMLLAPEVGSDPGSNATWQPRPGHVRSRRGKDWGFSPQAKWVEGIPQLGWSLDMSWLYLLLDLLDISWHILESHVSAQTTNGGPPSSVSTPQKKVFQDLESFLPVLGPQDSRANEARPLFLYSKCNEARCWILKVHIFQPRGRRGKKF